MSTLSNSPNSDSALRDRALSEFESAWEDGAPDLGEFVEERDLAPDTLLRLVEIDMSCQWEKGNHACSEEYLERLPQLYDLPDGVHRLIQAEKVTREKHGCEIPEDEYRLRFPGFFVGPPDDFDETDDIDALPETLARPVRQEGNVVTVIEGAEENPQLEGKPFQQTQDAAAPVEPDRNVPALKAIGRYTIRNVLGRGGWGIVYRAYDEDLKRDVAVKVPRPDVLSRTPGLAKEYRHEAQVVAQLDHDHIVRIYDVNSTDSLPCYLVTQFISGESLASKMRGGSLTEVESVELTLAMADALQHAHSHGVVHRDVKPGNIIVDDDGKPWLADFGLALDDESLAQKGEYAGTPSYMSPEQAGGEGHRIDGRSDVFSLGIVFYELLTKKRPFRGESTRKVMRNICDHDARPLRQLNSNIPKELERICLKALSRQISERYATAADFAEDLKLWQKSQLVETDVDENSTRVRDSSSVEQFVIPKGLRSFDEHDASFFHSLLPGARGRDGLPESVRFWKSRIEEPDGGSTFSVGLVYGPSGSGKSSLIRAGVIPQLDRTVTAVYVEATPDETEARIRRAVKAAAGISTDDDSTLAALFQTIRRERRGKIVVFVDQFEQWLQTNRDRDSELVRALRQCDGSHLQAVVMVRDDFWLAASRFMRELDIRILEGDNSNLVDLFPLPHAERVLTLFGQARDDLPKSDSEISDEQRAFVHEAVKSLAQDEKVVCVRLALFAEMMQGKEWLPETLQKMGGTSGIGITFLEETFSSPSAPIEHRIHQAAARNVLRALLPAAGTHLKGHMVPVKQLQEESEYGSLPGEFEDLLRVLDQRLRLITPTDPLGQTIQNTESVSDDVQDEGACYQLTHDYLVPTLREWLHLKQRETRSGRAELLLSEHAAIWENHQSGRQYLPSMPEWLRIRAFTKKARWTEVEAAMIAAANRLYLTRFAIVASVVVLLSAGFFHLLSVQQEEIATQQIRNDREKSETLVTVMLAAPATGYPYAKEMVTPFREYAITELHRLVEAGTLTESEQLHARLCLSDFGEPDVDFVVNAAQTCDVAECANIVKSLRKNDVEALTSIERHFRDARNDGQVKAATRLAVLALALGETGHATELAELKSDPWPRTSFVSTLTEWNCELADWAKMCKSVDSGCLRSALCLGIGSMSAMDQLALSEWQRVWTNWYINALDSGTHSAARWALTSQKLPVPTRFTDAAKSADWQHSPHGIVLLRIPSGEFSRVDVFAPGSRRHTVVLDTDLWISDREISIQQFHQFLKEAGKQVGWVDTGELPGFEFDDRDARWPIQAVTWFQAAAFCNWLSEKEGLSPVYILTNPVDHSAGARRSGGPIRPAQVGFTVEIRAGADGFRLPTEAEWEYAARAGTRSYYACGNDAKLEEYGNYGTRAPIICGSRKCNGWGLW